jgi:hypothetical protein
VLARDADLEGCLVEDAPQRALLLGHVLELLLDAADADVLDCPEKRTGWRLRTRAISSSTTRCPSTLDDEEAEIELRFQQPQEPAFQLLVADLAWRAGRSEVPTMAWSASRTPQSR